MLAASSRYASNSDLPGGVSSTHGSSGVPDPSTSLISVPCSYAADRRCRPPSWRSKTVAVLDRLQPIRVRRAEREDARGWVRATFRLGSIDGVALEVLSLGPDVEVLEPVAVRERVAALVAATAALYDTSD